jgi:hypothetical protein
MSLKKKQKAPNFLLVLCMFYFQHLINRGS